MNNLNKLLFVIFSSLMYSFPAFSQTIEWKEKPKWDSVGMLGNSLLRVELSGKWGVVGLDGTLIVPCENAMITNVVEGRFLVLNEKGKIISLISEAGNSFPIEQDWFVDTDYPYFSNERLAIHDSQGHWGFISLSGKVVIKPNNDYIRAYPFFYDLSVVQYNDKKKSWGYIYSDGSPLKFENKKLSDGYNKITYASSFTKIEGAPVALIRLYDTMYMIDQFGNILSHILKTPVPINILNISPGFPISSDNYSFVFNKVGEIVSLKKDTVEYTSLKKDGSETVGYPTINNIVIDKAHRIIVDELTLSSQFQEIVPLSSNIILVKKENKWGLLNINRDQEAVRIDYEMQTNNKLNKNTKKNVEFILVNGNEKTKAYCIDDDGGRRYLEITEDRISVPISFSKDKKITIGLEVDGVLLEPITVSTNSISSSPIGSYSPSSPIVKGGIDVILMTEKIDDGNRAVFNIKTKRNDYKDLKVIIGGKEYGLSKKEQTFSAQISFKGKKEVRISVIVKHKTGLTVYNKQFSILRKTN